MIDFPTNPSEGQYFTDTNGNGWKFEDSRWLRAKRGQTLTLSQMTDVSNDTPTENQLLKYNGSQFSPSTHSISVPADHKDYPTTRYPFRTTISHSYCGSSKFTQLPQTGWDVDYDPHNLLLSGTSVITIPAGAPNAWWRINSRFKAWVGGTSVMDFNTFLFVNNVFRKSLSAFVGSQYSRSIYLQNNSSVPVYLEAGDVVSFKAWVRHRQGYGVYVYDQVLRNYSREVIFTNVNKRIYCENVFNGYWTVGESIQITGSSSNNGTYTVVSIGTWYCEVSESITNETAPIGTVEFRNLSRNKDMEVSGYMERIV